MRRAPCSRPAARRPFAGFAGAAALLLVPFLVPADPAAQDECACLWQGSFADVQQDTDLVVAGTVATTKGNALDLAIERSLRGDPIFEEIRIWLRTRDYCRPPIEDFPAGSRWVMALYRIDEVPEGGFDPGTPNQSYGRKGDYYLSSCGGYWLTYSGEAVTGNLIDAPRWARDPEMQPVLMPLLEAFVRGRADREALAEASREDPALDELMLDTRAFLRGDEALEADDPPGKDRQR